MKGQWHKGVYQVRNPEKYVGGRMPVYRSSWELKFCQMCDDNSNILQWASENIKIPYRNPLTGRNANYIPDFLIKYMDNNGKIHVELIEIKPGGQTTMESARGEKERNMVILNSAKWAAAQEWSSSKGIRFRVLNEHHIFHTKAKRTKKKRQTRARVSKKSRRR